MNTPSGNNPYQAPNVDVTPQMHNIGGQWIEGGQTVAAGNGTKWIGESWTLFTKSPGIWIVNIILLFVMMMFLAFVPLLGQLISNLLMPIIIGGLMLGCRSLDAGGPLQIEHLFAGFKEKAGPLAILGLIMLAATIVIFMIVGAVLLGVFGASIFGAFGDQNAMAGLMATYGLMFMLVFLLLIMAISIPLAMAFWFAPALIVFHDLEPIPAMKNSFKGCLRNFIPFLLYGIVFFVLMILAIIPLGLGFFVIVPMIYASMYTAYKDIFLKP